MKINVIAVTTETKPTAKGSYQMIEVTYRNLDKNKVESKKLMSFSKPDTAFKALATAKGGDVYDVTMVKNEQSGYWDWTNAERSLADAGGGATSSSAKTSGTVQSATTRGGWETPEERAKKQVYIIRQSSLATAVEALSVGVKAPPKPSDVIEYAKELEAYVLDTGVAKAEVVARQDLDGFEDTLDDLPF